MCHFFHLANQPAPYLYKVPVRHYQYTFSTTNTARFPELIGLYWSTHSGRLDRLTLRERVGVDTVVTGSIADLLRLQ